MSGFDREGWEERWAEALRTHGDRLAFRPPNEHATTELADLPPGRALDAGCGHGAETMWLAARGWRVTAVDFAATALAHARSTAESLGLDIAERIDWLEADLGAWAPEREAYDLVVSIFVHVGGSVPELVRRLAAGVAPGGTLFLVGREAPGQVQVSVEDATSALDSGWQLAVAEHRGVDAVIRAVRSA